jgi:hypothetical protein
MKPYGIKNTKKSNPCDCCGDKEKRCIKRREREFAKIEIQDEVRDRFIAALSSTPVRNEAFMKAEKKFKKKYKEQP